MTDTEPAGLHDFDFLVGSWRVDNRRLSRPLSGAGDWYQFEATSWCRPMLGGAANVDEFNAPTLGLTGMTVRTLDATGNWSIYWASTTVLGPLQPPVVGRFTDDVGVFECNDEFGGQPIRTRYTWSEQTETSARWHQDFSPDGGDNWETNWVMQLSRT